MQNSKQFTYKNLYPHTPRFRQTGKLLLTFLGVVFVLALSIIYYLLSTTTASAAGVSVSPVKFEITANPGEQKSSFIKVINSSDSTLTIRIETEDFAPIGETGQVRLVSDTEYTFSLSKWVTFDPIEFLLEPREVKQVEFKIDVPLDAEPGGHYASILATAGGGAVEGGASIAQKVGSLLLLQVAGDIDEKLFVKSMQAVTPDPDKNEDFLPKDFFEYGAITVLTRFENTGTVHLKPRGFVKLTNMFGNEVDTVDIKQLNVLPNSIRRIPVELGSKWMFGKYTASLTAIYGSTNESLSYSTSFWVFPWRIGGAVGFGVLIFLLFIFKARKRLRVAFRVLFRGR